MSCHLRLEFLIWYQCHSQFVAIKKKVDAVQDNKHSFSMAFFMLTELQDTLQQGLPHGSATCSIKTCVHKHLRTIHKYGISMSRPKPLTRWSGYVMRAFGHYMSSNRLMASFLVLTTAVAIFWF